MITEVTSIIIFGCLAGAALVGKRVRRLLPENHLSADTKDTVKLAVGLVATTTALVLGLLLSTTKASYDTVRIEVLQMSAKVVFLDRALAGYGPEAREARTRFHKVVEEMIEHIWSGAGEAAMSPNKQAGTAFFLAIEQLSPRDDMQRSLKSQAASLALDIGQIRTLLMVQSAASMSKPLLTVVVAWLVFIFLSFGLLAPPNQTATAALLISALSLAGAMFLILELDRPFSGLIRVPSEPMVKALSQLSE